MSSELIIVLSVVGLGGLIGIFYVSYSIEKQRRERALLIANLSDHAFRLQRLLDYIPAAYVSKDIRLMLLKQIKKRLDRLVELAPANEKFRKKLDSCNAQITDIQNNAATPPPPVIKSPEEANELRTMLQELSRVIENFAQHKIISGDEAQKHLHSIHAGFIEANLNYFLHMGHNARQEKKPRLAIHHYQKALVEMGKRNQQGQYNEKIQNLQATIGLLQAEAGMQETPAEAEPVNELNKGMSEILEEKDAWKKKYF